MRDLDQVRVGDVGLRYFGEGFGPMRLRMTEVADELISCGGGHGWTFDRATGAEIDDELGWGPAYGITGSYLAGVEGTGDETDA